jgi:hypothetical protein
MTMCSTLRWLAAVVVFGISGLPAAAQDKAKPPVVAFDGPDIFCYLLNSRHFSPILSIDALRSADALDTMVVVFGQFNLPEFAAFRQRGGSMLVASDRHDTLIEGLVVDGRRVIQETEHAYRENRECPRIAALEPDGPADFHHLAKGLATNRPSFFRVEQPTAGRLVHHDGLRAVAGFDRTCFPDGAKEVRAIVWPNGKVLLPYIIAAGEGDAHHGRAILIAGQGLFTNGMLLQTDNDNFPFAVECLDWLGKRADGKTRKHALFIVDGKVIDTFDVGLNPPPLPLPPIPTPTIAVINHLLHGIEQEGILFRILEDSVNVQSAVRYALILLTLLLVCYGAKKLTEQRHHSESGSVLLAGPYALPPEMAPLARQRARAQVDVGALGAEAQAVVRTWFLETCSVPVSAWESAPASAAPDAFITGGWWDCYRVRRLLTQLAVIAGQRGPAVFSWVEMVRLTKTLQGLNAAVQEGRLRFAGCASPVARLAKTPKTTDVGWQDCTPGATR